MRAEKPEDRMPRAWPRYMTARIAADYADTSAWTIRRHVSPCGRRGRSFVYAIEDVEQWMRGQPIGTSNTAPKRVARRQATPAANSIERIRALARKRTDETNDDLADVKSGVSR